MAGVLTGKIGLITGAGPGTGRASALARPLWVGWKKVMSEKLSEHRKERTNEAKHR